MGEGRAGRRLVPWHAPLECGSRRCLAEMTGLGGVSNLKGAEGMGASRGGASARSRSLAAPPSPALAGLGLTVTIAGVGRQRPARAERGRDALCRPASLARTGCGV